MAKLSAGRPPEFLSTHPDPLNRIENMKKWMPKAKEYYAAAPKKMPKPTVARICGGSRSTSGVIRSSRTVATRANRADVETSRTM